ncbi:MAG: serine/threonine-protein kinase [Candidatus Eisenbacteria bacterium]
MSHLSDDAIRHLRTLADWPEPSGDRYRVLEQIGRGGMGGVYRTEDQALEREVALKVLSLPNLDEPSRDRLLREARILARLEHPGIVPVHDVGVLEDGRVFYTMKLIRGQRLDEFVGGDRLLTERLRVLVRVAEAVAFAHAHGVIHRDLKPENVMVGPFGEVLVLDWGVAKLHGLEESCDDPCEGDVESRGRRSSTQGDAGDTLDGTVLGTPGYMAPEQARGENARSIRDDVHVVSAAAAVSGGAPSPRLEAARDSAIARLDPARRYGEWPWRASQRKSPGSSRGAGHGVPGNALGASGPDLLRRHQVLIVLVLVYLVVLRGSARKVPLSHPSARRAAR